VAKAPVAAAPKSKPKTEGAAPHGNAAPVSSPAAVNAGASGKAEAPKDVQQRASNAFGESASEMKGKGNAATYLWIGRYQREDRAKAAKKKIEDLGLPAAIVAKHGAGGEAFVVFAGPFGAKRIASVTEWLKAQGFEGVHAVATPAPGVNQNH